MGVLGLFVAAWFIALFTGHVPGPDARKAAGLQEQIKTSLLPGTPLAQVKKVLDARQISYYVARRGESLFMSGADDKEKDIGGVPKEKIESMVDASLELRAGGSFGGRRLFLTFWFDRDDKLLSSSWYEFQPGF